MKKISFTAVATASVVFLSGWAGAASPMTGPVADQVVSEQRHELAKNTKNAGFGPQSPRDIDAREGDNRRISRSAPGHTQMNLCNIHFHESAEHKGGEFKRYAGNGDGHGYGTGFKYSGTLTKTELAPFHKEVGSNSHGSLVPGDTIEVHYVYTTAQVTPGPTLGACLTDQIKNPQLRVEAQVYVLVNDKAALDFQELSELAVLNGFHQAPNMPKNTGTPVEYEGSTTGPGYNEKGSPFHVTWNVWPLVAKVNIATVDAWLAQNVFDEDHAHGVRNLVTNPALLSRIPR